MEKISDDKVQDELIDKSNIQDELVERTNEQKKEKTLVEKMFDYFDAQNEKKTSQEKVFTKVGWVGEPAVTLVTRTICPECEAENSFNLNGTTIPTYPPKYRYICSKCGAILETTQLFSSIVYVDRKSYEEQVKKSGTTTVRGVYE